VYVTATAQREADEAYAWLEAQTPQHAPNWLSGLADAIDGLTDFPTRWSLARESREFDEEIRQLLYGKRPHIYRGLFVIRGNVVYVLHIRHGARQPLRRKDVRFPPNQPKSE